MGSGNLDTFSNLCSMSFLNSSISFSVFITHSNIEKI
jgi:hypothetical protein